MLILSHIGKCPLISTTPKINIGEQKIICCLFRLILWYSQQQRTVGGFSEQITPTLTANCPRLQKVLSPTGGIRTLSFRGRRHWLKCYMIAVTIWFGICFAILHFGLYFLNYGEQISLLYRGVWVRKIMFPWRYFATSNSIHLDKICNSTIAIWLIECG